MRLRNIALPIIPAMLTLAAASSASATERPALETSARACPGYGPGFVEVPGTSTCIRIGGRATAEYGTVSRRGVRDGVSGSRATGRLSLDTRTETSYGPLRTFVRMKAASDTIPGQR